jgi:hypothetical protein
MDYTPAQGSPAITQGERDAQSAGTRSRSIPRVGPGAPTLYLARPVPAPRSGSQRGA